MPPLAASCLARTSVCKTRSLPPEDAAPGRSASKANPSPSARRSSALARSDRRSAPSHVPSQPLLRRLLWRSL